jgi:hypothetical protein
MRINSRIRGRLLVLAALIVVVSWPELARAQQTGLFPNLPIRRQRVPCDQEDPIYKVYKNKYFGYHPTCWRQFPAGWGCPSPAGPDREASFKKYPFGGGAAGASRPPGEGEEGTEGQPGVTMPAKPPLPPASRSPFETNDPAAPPTTPRGRQTPSPTNPDDPFELDPKTPPAAPRSGQPRPGGPGAASNGPELSAPDDQPGRQGDRTTLNESSNTPNDPEGPTPILALPSVNVPPLDDPGVPFGTQPPASNTDVASNANANSSAATASGATTPRRGVLSGFFNNLGLNWARR